MIYQATGCVAKISLMQGFSALNGIYYIAMEMAFKDAISAKVDFMASLYTPAGKSSTDYQSDYANYLDDIVLVCNPVSGSSTPLYIPQSLLLCPPDATVKAFYRRIAVVDLGITNDANALLPAITQIGQIATAATGVLDSVSIVANKNDLTYMTDDEYQAYLAEVDKNKSDITNEVVLNQQLTAENITLRNRLAAAEAALVQYLNQKGSG